MTMVDGQGGAELAGRAGATRVAAWQCAPLPRDVAANLARLDEVAGRASAAGATLLVTPELVLTGYAIGAEAIARLAETADGPSSAAVAEIARRHGIAIAYGYPERAEDGTIYNAATLLDAEGEVLGRHRKVHLWGDVDRSRFTAGPAVPEAFGLGELTAGLLICYDVEFPEAVRHLAAAGARLVLVPTANPVGGEEVQEVLLRARALENGCVVVYANYCGADDALAYSGRSMVVGPDGTVLAEAPADAEALLVVDVAPGEGTLTDYLGDRRAELYRRSAVRGT